MSDLGTIVGVSWLAGLAASVGALLARYERIPESTAKQELIDGIVAFGGGLLVSAIAFALVPEGMSVLPPVTLAATFCLGGVAFCIVDARLSRKGGSKAQVMAMLMDFIPEALSLGAVFSQNRQLGLLLAAFIGAQNLPEGFNSYREIVAVGTRPRRTLAVLFAMSFFGPVAACLGYIFLQDHASLTAGIMSFAAGGILYLVFQDIAPQAKMKNHWIPPLGAVLGFAVGMLGNVLLG